MVEEPIIQSHADDGAGHTRTTIVRDMPQEKRAGVGGWLMLSLALMVAVAGLIFFNQAGSAEVVKDSDAAERGVDEAVQ